MLLTTGDLTWLTILFSAENAYVTVMAGFTTVQSIRSDNDAELRDAIARGAHRCAQAWHGSRSDCGGW